jgi:AraC-like DNA-binding protein
MVEIFDDIRKLYRFKDPCTELAAYIEFFSETSLDATREYITSEDFTVRLFPSYTPTIWLNLGSPYSLKNGDKWHTIDKDTDILLLRNGIVERKNLPSDNIFTIKFFPGGFEAIFGVGQKNIGSDILNASTVIPESSIQQLKGMNTFEERKALLENIFLEKIRQRKKEDHCFRCVKDSITIFYESGMEYSNTELARQLCIAEKTLYRYFMNVVGTNPKNYLATVRARTALTAYVTGSGYFSPYDYGYYDMSHFYKDVVKFTGHKLSFYHL